MTLPRWHILIPWWIAIAVAVSIEAAYPIDIGKQVLSGEHTPVVKLMPSGHNNGASEVTTLLVTVRLHGCATAAGGA